MTSRFLEESTLIPGDGSTVLGNFECGPQQWYPYHLHGSLCRLDLYEQNRTRWTVNGSIFPGTTLAWNERMDTGRYDAMVADSMVRDAQKEL